MNYRNETYLVLSEKAEGKLTGDVEVILYGKKSKHVNFISGSVLFQMKKLSFKEDKVITDWLDTLNADLDETFEVVAKGGQFDEIEHITNAPERKRLSVEIRVMINSVPVDLYVPENNPPEGELK